MAIPVKTPYKKRISSYLFLGNDNESKENRINQIRNQNIRRDTWEFNLDILHAKETTPHRLKEALGSLPVNSKERLLIIKDPEKFSPENKEAVLSYFKKPQQSNIIIFDTQEFNIKDNAFLMSIANESQVVNFQKDRPYSGFDLGRVINTGNSKLALKILSELLERGQKPHFILGSIISQWSRNYDKRYITKGYEVILETDLAIKTGRIKPRVGLEILVLKLSTGFVKSAG